MQRLVFNYQGLDVPVPSSERGQYLSYVCHLYSQAFRWFAAFSVIYPMEFLCFSISQLLVLDRLYRFAVLLEGSSVGVTHPAEAKTRCWFTARRVVMAMVVSGNVAGFAGNLSAAVFHSKSSDRFIEASLVAAANVNISSEALALFNQGRDYNQRAVSVGSVQSFCEVFVLLLILASYSVVSAACVHRIRSIMLSFDACSPASMSLLDSMAKKLHSRILFTTVSVFVAFLLRSIFSTMHAVANHFQDYDKQCGGASFCNTCYNIYSNISFWMFLTPEFQMIVVLVSSPLAMLIALWGMTPAGVFSSSTSRDDTGSRMIFLEPKSNSASTV